MIKRIKDKKKMRLVDLQGVLLYLIEESQDEKEREFYTLILDSVSEKLKEI